MMNFSKDSISKIEINFVLNSLTQSRYFFGASWSIVFRDIQGHTLNCIFLCKPLRHLTFFFFQVKINNILVGSAIYQ